MYRLLYLALISLLERQKAIVSLACYVFGHALRFTSDQIKSDENFWLLAAGNTMKLITMSNILSM